MPVSVRKQKCRDSKGNTGNFVTFERSTGKQKSCHGSRSDAEAAARIRNEATAKESQETDPIRKAVWIGIKKGLDNL